MKKKSPSYKGLSPASPVASRVAKTASAKRDTGPELLLRRELWKKGLRYRIAVESLPGKPDVVVQSARLAVFCDGDFWHGRHLKQRMAKLSKGHNASYWTSKIQRNVERDKQTRKLLIGLGWKVLRCWESDIRANPALVAETVLKAAQEKVD